MSPWRRLATRIALAPVRLLGRLPPAPARALMRPLGPLLYATMRRRRRIARRNLELCFPQLNQAERHRLLRAHFRNLAVGLAETAMAWRRRRPLDGRFGSVEGLEHIDAAAAGGRGVILITGHSTCLEPGGRLLAEQVSLAGVYRPLSNRELESFQNRSRARYTCAMFRRDDLRGMVRHLRAGGMLWYAPDQDFGPRRSHFAPFFSIATATAIGILELARLGRAAVVPVFPHKDERSGRITVRVQPALAPFPTDDPVADLGRYNAFLEEQIRQVPAQYWWLHRRFKSAPAGEPPRYREIA